MPLEAILKRTDHVRIVKAFATFKLTLSPGICMMYLTFYLFYGLEKMLTSGGDSVNHANPTVGIEPGKHFVSFNPFHCVSHEKLIGRLTLTSSRSLRHGVNSVIIGPR